MSYIKDLGLRVDIKFRDVVGYEGLYKVTEDGDVISCPKRWITGRGTERSKGWTLLSLRDNRGYARVSLTGHDGVRKSFSVHRLVAIAFIPNPNNYPEVNHIDCVKNNNKVSNLEWCNASYNAIHAVKNGLRVPLSGENHPQYGVRWSEERRKSFSDKTSGENNSFYGRKHTDETKSLISAKRKSALIKNKS